MEPHLPHDRRRERPVGPGQFHSERRIRAGRVVPPGRCGFAMGVQRETRRDLEGLHQGGEKRNALRRYVHLARRHRRRFLGRATQALAEQGGFPGTWPPGGVERRCSKREPVSNRHVAPSGGSRAVFAPPHRRGFSNHVLPGGVAMPQKGAPQFGPLCRMIAAGRGPSDRAVWCLPGGADLPWCAAAGAQLPGHWIRFGASLPHDRRRERPVGPGHVVPSGRCGFAMVRRSRGASARPLDSIWSLSAPWSPPGEARRTGPCGAFRAVRICHGAPQRGRKCPATGFDLEPLCRMIGAGRGPSDRASFIQRGESERAVWCLPGGADLPWCAAAGAQLPGHWIRFGASLPHDRRRGGPSDRASFIQRGESERAVWCLPGRPDLPMCAAAGAQLPGHWIRFGASLPQDRHC